MKCKRFLILTICAAILCGGIAACGEESASSTVSSLGSSASAASGPSLAASAAESQTETAASSQTPPVSASQAETNEGGAITPGPASQASSPETAFDQKWAENPLDAAYEKDSEEADSMQEMISLANTYAVQWQSAMIDAYKKLFAASGNDPAVEQAQQTWEDEAAAFLQDLSASAQTGTSGALSAATQKMEFYRSRAKALYEQLYAYDPDFTYDQTE